MYKIYSKAGCIFCDAAMELLEKHNIAYEEIKVQLNEDAMNLFRQRKWKTVPQIINDKGTHIGGYDDLKKIL
jgi:glutaredoxin